jgi:hypothetical protein
MKEKQESIETAKCCYFCRFWDVITIVEDTDTNEFCSQNEEFTWLFSVCDKFELRNDEP